MPGVTLDSFTHDIGEVVRVLQYFRSFRWHATGMENSEGVVSVLEASTRRSASDS